MIPSKVRCLVLLRKDTPEDLASDIGYAVQDALGEDASVETTSMLFPQVQAIWDGENREDADPGLLHNRFSNVWDAWSWFCSESTLGEEEWGVPSYNLLVVAGDVEACGKATAGIVQRAMATGRTICAATAPAGLFTAITGVAEKKGPSGKVSWKDGYKMLLDPRPYGVAGVGSLKLTMREMAREENLDQYAWGESEEGGEE
ncbi:MAG: hypothetical protein WC869_08075 [Phycisphaerae bacterium]